MLQGAPTRLSNKQGLALLEALQVLEFDVEEARDLAQDRNPQDVHCLRCHASYKERDNNKRSCDVRHDREPDTTDDIFGNWRETCTSCGWISEDDGDPCPEMPLYCYRGMHTADPYIVCQEYGTTIKSCKKLRCGQDIDEDEEDEAAGAEAIL